MNRCYFVSREFSGPFSFSLFAILHMCKTVNMHTQYISDVRSWYLEKCSLLHFSPDTYLLKKLSTLKIILLTLLPLPVEQPLPLVRSSLSDMLCSDTLIRNYIQNNWHIYSYTCKSTEMLRGIIGKLAVLILSWKEVKAWVYHFCQGCMTN